MFWDTPGLLPHSGSLDVFVGFLKVISYILRCYSCIGGFLGKTFLCMPWKPPMKDPGLSPKQEKCHDITIANVHENTWCPQTGRKATEYPKTEIINTI